MRVIAQFPQPDCHVTLFAWNGKFIVKIERDNLEQTFKIPEMDVAGEADIRSLIGDEAFMAAVRERFEGMQAALHTALEG